MSATTDFIEANQVLGNVIAQITDDLWDKPVPAVMSWKPNQTLRDIINYHAYDDAWVPDVLAGKTAEEVGKQYEELLTTNETLKQYAKYNHRAVEAVSTNVNLERTVHLSYGDFTAGEYLTHITLFRGLRVFDISRFIGVPDGATTTLIDALWDIVKTHEESLREMKVIGEALPVSEAASRRDQLLAVTGRQP